MPGGKELATAAEKKFHRFLVFLSLTPLHRSLESEDYRFCGRVRGPDVLKIQPRQPQLRQISGFHRSLRTNMLEFVQTPAS